MNGKLSTIEREWAEEVERTLLLVEDRKRLRANLPPAKWERVFMPTPDQRLSLLNWKVWTLRYHVSLDFLLTFFLRIYADQRKISRDHRTLSLGLPVSMVTGPGARKRLEEEVARMYPNRENRLADRSPFFLPVKRLAYDDLDQMTEKYGAVMLKRHKMTRTQTVPKRAYRKV